MNLLPDKHLFTNVLFQSNKDTKKEVRVDIEVQETIGDIFCPTRRMNSVFTFQPLKCLVSGTVKDAKHAVTF